VLFFPHANNLVVGAVLAKDRVLQNGLTLGVGQWRRVAHNLELNAHDLLSFLESREDAGGNLVGGALFVAAIDEVVGNCALDAGGCYVLL
jgi:hypothetical protein